MVTLSCPKSWPIRGLVSPGIEAIALVCQKRGNSEQSGFIQVHRGGCCWATGTFPFKIPRMDWTHLAPFQMGSMWQALLHFPAESPLNLNS